MSHGRAGAGEYGGQAGSQAHKSLPLTASPPLPLQAASHPLQAEMYSCQLIHLKGWEDREGEGCPTVIYSLVLRQARLLLWAVHREQSGMAWLPRERELSAVKMATQLLTPWAWVGAPGVGLGSLPQVKWEIQEREGKVGRCRRGQDSRKTGVPGTFMMQAECEAVGAR